MVEARNLFIYFIAVREGVSHVQHLSVSLDLLGKQIDYREEKWMTGG